ncbi:hypothetical protein OIO90_003519 [Microbotryomycetes sp. JL221]|nr:hypothetical protein OIO90_003519 [Microbotryomycetes sp. JL221]
MSDAADATQALVGATTSALASATGPRRGVSQLPTSRVNKLVKLDPDVKLCSKEALFLISKLTEGTIMRLTSSAQQNARIRKRNKQVQYNDLAQAVQRPEWFFLQDVIRPGAPLGKQQAGVQSAVIMPDEVGQQRDERAPTVPDAISDATDSPSRGDASMEVDRVDDIDQREGGDNDAADLAVGRNTDDDDDDDLPVL